MVPHYHVRLPDGSITRRSYNPPGYEDVNRTVTGVSDHLVLAEGESVFRVEDEIIPLLEEAEEQLRAWLLPIYKNATRLHRAIYVDKEGLKVVAKIWTFTNEYTIKCCVDGVNSLSKAYLGATCSSRKSRAGETWTRGCDLPDGKMNESTWNSIVLGILSQETQEVKSIKWKEKR